MLLEPKIGEIYKGKVKKITDYGAFIEFSKGIDGLLHISEIMWGKVENIRDELEINEEIEVKLIDIDNSRGQKRYALSRRALIPRDR